MNGFGKHPYGTPFRSNTEYSGLMRHYRFWRLQFDNTLRTKRFDVLNGISARRQNLIQIRDIEMRDVDGNDLLPKAIRGPKFKYGGTGMERTFYPDTNNKPTFTFEWYHPVLVWSVYLDMQFALLDWHYQYSWDGVTWVTIKTEDATPLYDTHENLYFQITRNLWT